AVVLIVVFVQRVKPSQPQQARQGTQMGVSQKAKCFAQWWSQGGQAGPGKRCRPGIDIVVLARCKAMAKLDGSAIARDDIDLRVRDTKGLDGMLDGFRGG